MQAHIHMLSLSHIYIYIWEAYIYIYVYLYLSLSLSHTHIDFSLTQSKHPRNILGSLKGWLIVLWFQVLLTLALILFVFPFSIVIVFPFDFQLRMQTFWEATEHICILNCLIFPHESLWCQKELIQEEFLLCGSLNFPVLNNKSLGGERNTSQLCWPIIIQRLEWDTSRLSSFKF